jgi:hypothetical protein
VEEGEYGECTLCTMYENRTVKPVEVVLYRGEGKRVREMDRGGKSN